MYGLNILPYDSAFPGLPNRTDGKQKSVKPARGFVYKQFAFTECLLENIGKPVFHRYSSDLFGSWMQVGQNIPF